MAVDMRSQPHAFKQRSTNGGPRSSEPASSFKEIGAVAYCLVKSRPYDGHSYDDMISATESIPFPQSHTLIMLPQLRVSTTIPVVDKLRTILADEATLLDAETRSVWTLQLDPLTVMNTLSQLGFRATQFSVNPNDGVHTWTLACSGKNAVKKAVVKIEEKVDDDDDDYAKTTVHAKNSSETAMENREPYPGTTNGNATSGSRMRPTNDRRSVELANLYEQSSHADYENDDDDDDDFSFPSEDENMTDMHRQTRGNANPTNSSAERYNSAKPSVKKPFIRKSLELMPKSSSASVPYKNVGSVGSAERSINKSGAHRRPRTNILPEQYDYMFQQFSHNSNPTRAHIDAIAERLALSVCVVRVWFQNARALERRGVLNVAQQKINKRCPICRVRFSARSSLEQHIIAKHSDTVTNRSTTIDQLPTSDTEGINDEPINSIMAESRAKYKANGRDV